VTFATSRSMTTTRLSSVFSNLIRKSKRTPSKGPLNMFRPRRLVESLRGLSRRRFWCRVRARPSWWTSVESSRTPVRPENDGFPQFKRGLPAGPQAVGAVRSGLAGSDGACSWDGSNPSEPGTGGRAGGPVRARRDAGWAIQRAPPHSSGTSSVARSQSAGAVLTSATCPKRSSCTRVGWRWWRLGCASAWASRRWEER